MAVPKRKKSRSTTRHRKAQWMKKGTPVSTTTCPQCKQATRMHTACATCGTYRGRQVVEPRL